MQSCAHLCQLSTGLRELTCLLWIHLHECDGFCVQKLFQPLVICTAKPMVWPSKMISASGCRLIHLSNFVWPVLSLANWLCRPSVKRWTSRVSLETSMPMILSICLFYLVLSYEPEAQVSVQVIRKDEGDLTPPRSIMTKRKTIRPSPLPDINVVLGNGPCIAQEPGSG